MVYVSVAGLYSDFWLACCGFLEGSSGSFFGADGNDWDWDYCSTPSWGASWKKRAICVWVRISDGDVRGG